MFTLLFIEDDEAIRTALRLVLEDEGYEVAVAGDGETGLKMFSQIDPDLVLLDLRLPDISGFEVCRSIRRTSITPVIMVTAQTDTSDLVNGFDAGADDYVTKPYSSRELIARIKAVLRRGISDADLNGDLEVISVGPIRLDTARHQASINGNPIALPLKEFELLEFLMRNSGRVLTRSQLIDRVWGGDYFGDTKTLDVHIKRLRAKIEADPANPVLIQTIRGLGYKLES